MEWRELSICESLPWDEKKYFFGDAKGIGTHKQHEMARLYCYTCPVQLECLEWCVEEDMFWGVWGGLTESQRKRYLMPAVRKNGLSSDVLVNVLRVRGLRILKQLEARGDAYITINGYEEPESSEESPPLVGRVPLPVLAP